MLLKRTFYKRLDAAVSITTSTTTYFTPERWQVLCGNRSRLQASLEIFAVIEPLQQVPTGLNDPKYRALQASGAVYSLSHLEDGGLAAGTAITVDLVSISALSTDDPNERY